MAGQKRYAWAATAAMVGIGLMTAGMLSAAALAAPQRAPDFSRPLAPEASGVEVPQGFSKDGADAKVDAPRKTVKVGLLLPLTGRHAELGRAMQDVATVALFDKYARLSRRQQGIQVILLPKDTGDSPDLARLAITEAIEDGVSMVIGPVFSDAMEVVAPIAQEKKVPVLSFSNNHARRVEGAYLLGFSPQEQAGRVVRYAAQQGKKRIAVLAPRSQLGDEVLAAARAAASDKGASVTVEAQYAPQAMGLEEALAKLIPHPGVPEFDALLLAEGGPALDTILRALSARGINATTTQLLGTGAWDDPALLRRVNLDGAWFATSAPEDTAMFENRFQTVYKYTPPRLSSLAYDAVALAVTLAVSDKPYNEASLTGKGGFSGPANGMFRLLESGAAERALTVVQVNNGALQVLSPAPKRFED